MEAALGGRLMQRPSQMKARVVRTQLGQPTPPSSPRPSTATPRSKLALRSWRGRCGGSKRLGDLPALTARLLVRWGISRTRNLSQVVRPFRLHSAERDDEAVHDEVPARPRGGRARYLR